MLACGSKQMSKRMIILMAFSQGILLIASGIKVYESRKIFDMAAVAIFLGTTILFTVKAFRAGNRS